MPRYQQKLMWCLFGDLWIQQQIKNIEKYSFVSIKIMWSGPYSYLALEDQLCFSEMPPVFTNIVNLSLSTSTVPYAQNTKRSIYGNWRIALIWLYSSAIWYYKPYTTAPTAWLRNQSCCIGPVQILFESADTIRCYQWYTVITSRYVFRSASGISTRHNNIHPAYHTAGCNSTKISTKFPF